MFFPAAQNGSVVSRLGVPHLSEHPDIAADGDHARARASEDAKRFGLVLPQRLQLGGDFVERLLPADCLELPFATRADPLQRLRQTALVMVHLQGVLRFRADPALEDRVFFIARYLHQFVSGKVKFHAASVEAERATAGLHSVGLTLGRDPP